jgi:hypothetical protein
VSVHKMALAIVLVSSQLACGQIVIETTVGKDGPGVTVITEPNVYPPPAIGDVDEPMAPYETPYETALRNARNQERHERREQQAREEIERRERMPLHDRVTQQVTPNVAEFSRFRSDSL